MKKILVIGEKCIDTFEYGHCTRLNPEAPTPVFISHRVTKIEGMAANVYNNVNSLAPGEATFVPQFGLTITKHRYVDLNSNYILLRVDDDGPAEEIKFTESLVKEIREADAVIVSDYDKGYLSKLSLEAIANNSSLSFIDTKKPLGFWAENFSWIKINEKEYSNPLNDQNFLNTHAKNIVVTTGSKGARIDERKFTTSPTQVKDVVGAGDSFLAAFALAWLKTHNIQKTMDFANLAGSHVVKKIGISDLTELKIYYDLL